MTWQSGRMNSTSSPLTGTFWGSKHVVGNWAVTPFSGRSRSRGPDLFLFLKCGSVLSGGSRCQECDVEAGADDEGSAEKHPESGELVKDEEGHDGARNQLRVVVLGDI